MPLASALSSIKKHRWLWLGPASCLVEAAKRQMVASPALSWSVSYSRASFVKLPRCCVQPICSACVDERLVHTCCPQLLALT